MTALGKPPASVDEFLAYYFEYLRTERDPRYPNGACDIWVSRLVNEWLHAQGDRDPTEQTKNLASIDALEAAWELVRRGVLRPGGKVFNDANSGHSDRFSLTTRGRSWLEQSDSTDLIVLRPTALARTLARYEPRFGPVYRQRYAEALICKEASAWLATCVMCGAASETVLLALATRKTDDVKRVIGEYKGAAGRKKTIDFIIGKQTQEVQKSFKLMIDSLSYWRDDAAHGLPTNLSEADAEMALLHLLRLVQFSDQYWSTLTGSS